jgi:hypothetical protein
MRGKRGTEEKYACLKIKIKKECIKQQQEKSQRLTTIPHNQTNNNTKKSKQL